MHGNPSVNLRYTVLASVPFLAVLAAAFLTMEKAAAEEPQTDPLPKRFLYDGLVPLGPDESVRQDRPGAPRPAKSEAVLAPRADKTSVEAIRKKLVGNWRLVSFESTGRDGKTSRVEMVGRIMYDAHGNMAAQLMPTAKREDTETPQRTPGYIAYFGAYEIDPDNETLTHYPEGATFSRWVGGEQVRRYAFKDNLLTLTMRMGDRVVGILTWEPIR